MDSVTSQVNEPFETLIAVPVKEVKELWKIQRWFSVKYLLTKFLNLNNKFTPFFVCCALIYVWFEQIWIRTKHSYAAMKKH